MISVYFKTDSIVARLAAKILHTDNCAIVFRRTIHLYNITKPEIIQNRQLLCHELTHVMQWKKYGIIRFPILYLWYSFKYGYYQNPFEVEARAKENDFSVLNKVVLL